MNPYDILGVPPDASDDDIKKAYRRKAMEAHPDRGGSSERMREVQLAYEVLSEPRRRAMFDAGGGIGLDEASLMHQAEKLVMDAFDHEVEGSAPDPVQEIKLSLLSMRTMASNEASKIPARIAKLEKARRQIKSKGSNLAHVVIDNKLLDLRRVKAQLEQKVVLVDKALALMSDYTHERDTLDWVAVSFNYSA